MSNAANALATIALAGAAIYFGCKLAMRAADRVMRVIDHLTRYERN